MKFGSSFPPLWAPIMISLSRHPSKFANLVILSHLMTAGVMVALSLKIYETIIILKYGKILGFADWRITQ